MISGMSGNPINVGGLIATNINEISRLKLTTLGQNSLNNWFYEEKHIPDFRSDMRVTSILSINDKAMLGFEKTHQMYMKE